MERTPSIKRHCGGVQRTATSAVVFWLPHFGRYLSSVLLLWESWPSFLQKVELGLRLDMMGCGVRVLRYACWWMGTLLVMGKSNRAIWFNECVGDVWASFIYCFPTASTIVRMEGKHLIRTPADLSSWLRYDSLVLLQNGSLVCSSPKAWVPWRLSGHSKHRKGITWLKFVWES